MPRELMPLPNSNAIKLATASAVARRRLAPPRPPPVAAVRPRLAAAPLKLLQAEVEAEAQAAKATTLQATSPRMPRPSLLVVSWLSLALPCKPGKVRLREADWFRFGE